MQMDLKRVLRKRKALGCTKKCQEMFHDGRFNYLKLSNLTHLRAGHMLQEKKNCPIFESTRCQFCFQAKKYWLLSNSTLALNQNLNQN